MQVGKQRQRAFHCPWLSLGIRRVRTAGGREEMQGCSCHGKGVSVLPVCPGSCWTELTDRGRGQAGVGRITLLCFFFFLKKFTFFYLFIYLFMTVLSLRFCARAFPSLGKWGPLFIAVRGPLTIAASLVEEHRLQTRRLSNCGSRA